MGWVFVILVLVLAPTLSLLAQDQNQDNPGPAQSQSQDNPGPPQDQSQDNASIPQDQNQNSGGSPSSDPPSRVARIEYLSGQVSLQPGGVNDWVTANLNRPLTTSDRVWTDKDSRAELNVGTGYLRMSSESSLTLTNVGDNTIQAELDQGVLELTVRHLEPGEIYEVDTPNLAFTVMKTGVYRFDVHPDDDQTWVTVRKGKGEATGSGNAVKVSDGQQVRFSGQNSLQHTAYAAPAPDGFDDWAKVRDKRLEDSVSARYVAPGTIGYEDLDTYGTWQTVGTYGNVWFPSGLAVGWAPYRYGHWAFIAPWGWTWVDSAPWGFAPFHYGRWVNWGGAWGWAPGPVYGVGWRPYYAPALVGWIGGGGWGFGISVGFGGGCGWFPLGWGEPFYPWYHGYRGGYLSRNYIRQVNVTNTRITNVTNVTNNYYNNSVNNTRYVNRNIAGAVTAAPKSALASGQNIARVGTVVPRADLGKGQVVRSVDVTPTKQAVLGGQTPRNTGLPPRSAFNRPAVTRATPPARQANPVVESQNVPKAPATVGARNPNTAAGAVGTHNVPRPPATNTAGANGATNPQVRTNTPKTPVKEAEAIPPTHSVPRPPEHAATPTAPPASSHAAQSGSTQTVPKPSYAGGNANTGTTPTAHYPEAGNQSGRVVTPPHIATPAPQPPPSVQHSPQPSQPKQSKPATEPKGNPGVASVNVPRPPAGYGYRGAPAYSAPSYAGTSGSSYGAARAYSAPAAPYGSSRGSYAAPVPAYRSGGGYNAPSAYSARSSAPATPHYSAPPAPHYSNGGSSGGGHYSGGGSSHASSGHSGGHSR